MLQHVQINGVQSISLLLQQKYQRILPTDILHDLPKRSFVRRVLSAFSQLAEPLAEDTAVILVAWERAERA